MRSVAGTVEFAAADADPECFEDELVAATAATTPMITAAPAMAATTTRVRARLGALGGVVSGPRGSLMVETLSEAGTVVTSGGRTPRRAAAAGSSCRPS